MSKTIVTFASILLLITGCNILGDDSDPDSVDPAINQGIYEQQAQQISVGDSIISASPVGSYFKQTFQFLNSGEVHLKVFSDIVSENGDAEAVYTISGDQLILDVKQSSTPLFQEGEEFSYISYKEVSESFDATFETEAGVYTFSGQGLILQKEHPDGQDLDGDDNTKESVVVTEYFKYVLKYD